MQSFGTPLAQFVHTISRIARIITFTALGVATIGVVSFEAAHQYVEHIAMPAASPLSSKGEADEFGWSQLALEESWSGSPSHTGTDPRLGIKGRHAVRSAWMCVNWGGGISPGVLFGGGAAGNSGLGRTAITSMESAKTLKVDDGMILAMQYLNLAVQIAARKGIKLPDTDAIRAGLVSEVAAKEQLSNVDPLALALEARLAAVKERQGSRGALESAIASYEKLYDIASMTSQGDKASKLVRLATKLGDLHSALDKEEEAGEWLNRAISIAAMAGAHTPETQDTSFREQVQEKSKQGHLGGWFSKASPPAASSTAAELPAPAAVARPKAETEGSSRVPSPALSRSLITTLVSKSAFHARSRTPSSLQQALQTQMSALQLASAELERISSHASSQPAELHNLWLTHHQSILDLHVAETIFALTRSQSTSSKLLPSWIKGASGFRGAKAGGKSIEWVDQADARAEKVVRALQGGNGKAAKKRKEHVVELEARWTGRKELALAAARLLRDAKRVRETARKSRSALEAV